MPCNSDYLNSTDAAIFWRFDIVGVIAVSYSMLAVIAFVHIQTEHQPYPRDINFDRGE